MLLALTTPLSGCRAYVDAVGDSSLAMGAFVVGGVAGGAAPILAAAPITVPAALASKDRDSWLYFFVPGVPTGLVAGAIVSLPFVLFDWVVEGVRSLRRRVRPPMTLNRGQPPQPVPTLLEEWNRRAVGRYGTWPSADPSLSPSTLCTCGQEVRVDWYQCPRCGAKVQR